MHKREKIKLQAAWALCVSAWLMAFPILPKLHIAAADHGHRHCAVHQRMEDIEGAHGSVSLPLESAEIKGPSVLAPAGNENPDPPCCLSTPAIETPAAVTVSYPLAAKLHRCCNEYRCDPDKKIVTPLAESPKHSPPAPLFNAVPPAA